MSTGSKRRGFSLIEALVAVAVTGIGVTAALGGMKALSRGELRAIQSEIVQRLAFEKYDEVVATGEIVSAPLNGDFQDRNIDTYKWAVEVEQSGVENLNIVTVRVTPADDSQSIEGHARGLVYVPPVPTEEGGGG